MGIELFMLYCMDICKSVSARIYGFEMGNIPMDDGGIALGPAVGDKEGLEVLFVVDSFIVLCFIEYL